MMPRRLLPVIATLLALSGCANPRGTPAPDIPPPPAEPPPICIAEPPPAPPPREPAPAADACHASAVQALLQHADRIRGLDATALASETARREEAGEPDGEHNLRLALALAQTRQPADTARALGLVQRALGQADAAALHPLARLLEERLLQQRRLEEQLDRQNHLLRDAQRRNDLLGERLEAMRALERSLNARPAPPSARGAEGAGRDGAQPE